MLAMIEAIMPVVEMMILLEMITLTDGQYVCYTEDNISTTIIDTRAGIGDITDEGSNYLETISLIEIII